MAKKKSEKEPKEKKSGEKKAGAKRKKSALGVAPLVVVDTAAPVAGDEKRKMRISQPVKKSGSAKGSVTDEDIGLRAYFIHERRHKMGWPGDATSDWVEAERQLAAESARKK